MLVSMRLLVFLLTLLLLLLSMLMYMLMSIFRRYPLGEDDIHVVFSTDCSNYQAWQAVVLFHSAILSGHMGPITQLVSKVFLLSGSHFTAARGPREGSGWGEKGKRGGGVLVFCLPSSFGR